MRFASLGSGSKGNALLVEAGSTRILIDCGFGPRNLAQRCARLGIAPDSIAAVLVTHEHSDHVGGAYPCARRYGMALHMTRGTRAGSLRRDEEDARITCFDSHVAFAIGDL